MSRKCVCGKWIVAGVYVCKHCGRGEADTLKDAKDGDRKLLSGLLSVRHAVLELTEAKQADMLKLITSLDSLPVDCVALVVKRGGPLAVLEAALKKDPKLAQTVPADALEGLIAFTEERSREAEAAEKEESAASEALRDRVLKGVDVAHREQEKLSALRTKAKGLRNKDFLEFVLSKLDVSSCPPEQVSRAKTLLAAAEKAIADRAPSPVMTPARPRLTSPDDAPTGEVSAEPGIMAKEVKVTKDLTEKPVGELSRDLFTVSLKAEDTVAGADNDQSEASFDLEAVLASDALTISGSLLPSIKRIEATYATLKTNVEEAMKVTKVSRAFRLTFPNAPNFQWRISVNMWVSWFALLSTNETCTEQFSFFLSFEKSRVRLCFPAPFRKLQGLADECLKFFSQQGSRTSGGRGDIVEREVLKKRLETAIAALLTDPERSTKWRHLWTLYQLYCVNARLTGTNVFLPKETLIRSLCYKPATELFTAYKDNLLMKPLVGSLKLEKDANGRQQMSWTGTLFRREVCRMLTEEAQNCLVFAHGDVMFPLEEYIRSAMQFALTTQEFSAIGRTLTTPCFLGLSVRDVFLLHDNWSSSAVSRVYNTGVVALDTSLYVAIRPVVAQLIAFCMGKHPRLGAQSPVRLLPPDMMKLIGRKVLALSPFLEPPRSSKGQGRSYTAYNNSTSKFIVDDNSVPKRVGETVCYGNNWGQPKRDLLSSVSTGAPLQLRMILFCVPQMEFDQLMQLPADVIAMILLKCQPIDVSAFACASKAARALVESRQIFKRLCYRAVPKLDEMIERIQSLGVQKFITDERFSTRYHFYFYGEEQAEYERYKNDPERKKREEVHKLPFFKQVLAYITQQQTYRQLASAILAEAPRSTCLVQ